MAAKPKAHPKCIGGGATVQASGISNSPKHASTKGASLADRWMVGWVDEYVDCGSKGASIFLIFNYVKN